MKWQKMWMQSLQRSDLRIWELRNGRIWLFWRRTTMPAILIETGFIDSDKDNYLFDYRFEDIVNAIALGIDETLRG